MGRRLLRARSRRTSACPAGFAVNPNVAVRAADDVPRRRGDGHRARPRRRPLLRLLARPLLHLRRAPPGPHRRVAGVPGDAATSSASRGEIVAADGADARRQAARRRASAALRGAIGTPDQVARAARALRGGRRRPGDLRARRPGRNRHEHICESLELFATEVMPGSPSGTRSASATSASAWRARWSGRSSAERAPAAWRTRLRGQPRP